MEMTKEVYQKVISDLSDNGIMFMINAVDGGQLMIDDADALKVIMEKSLDGVYADIDNVSIEDITEWKKTKGDIRCSAITKNGIRCKNLIAYRVPPHEWVARQNEYCKVHRKVHRKERVCWSSNPDIESDLENMTGFHDG